MNGCFGTKQLSGERTTGSSQKLPEPAQHGESLNLGIGMYCCKCGTQLMSDSVSCHNCGWAVPAEPPRQVRAVLLPGSSVHNQDAALIKELRSIDRRPHNCHSCGRTEDLLAWNFGLGKPVSSQREWTGTALSIAFSAVTIPLLGIGALQTPRKSTLFRILPLKLVLCRDCLGKKKGYEVHPWWALLRRYGYTEFVHPEHMK